MTGGGPWWVTVGGSFRIPLICKYVDGGVASRALAEAFKEAFKTLKHNKHTVGYPTAFRMSPRTSTLLTPTQDRSADYHIILLE